MQKLLGGIIGELEEQGLDDAMWRLIRNDTIRPGQPVVKKANRLWAHGLVRTSSIRPDADGLEGEGSPQADKSPSEPEEG